MRKGRPHYLLLCSSGGREIIKTCIHAVIVVDEDLVFLQHLEWNQHTQPTQQYGRSDGPDEKSNKSAQARWLAGASDVLSLAPEKPGRMRRHGARDRQASRWQSPKKRYTAGCHPFEQRNVVLHEIALSLATQRLLVAIAMSIRLDDRKKRRNSRRAFVNSRHLAARLRRKGVACHRPFSSRSHPKKMCLLVSSISLF